MTTSIVGGCVCGTIRYEAREPILFTVLCHCHMCQQWTGSAMLGSATFARNSVVFTNGAPKIHQSSSVCERGFCGECGSSLFTRYSSDGAFDKVLFISIGTLDYPELAKPEIHYGAEGELSWMHREDGLPRIAIDVDDPAKQGALFEELMRQGMERNRNSAARTRD